MGWDLSEDQRDVDFYGGNPAFSGDGSVDVSGSSPYAQVETPSNDFAFASDFTVELFGLEFISIEDPGTFISFGGGSPQWGWYILLNSGNLEFAYSMNGSSINAINAAWSPSLATKYDICVDRSGTTTRMYLDGSVHASGTISGAFHASTSPLLIGRLTTGSTFADGHIHLDAVRITDGVARYANSGGYTVPTLPLPTA